MQPSQRRHYNPTVVKQHIGPGTTHSIYLFENGYGASVIPEYDPMYSGLSLDWSGAVIPDCLELAILKHEPDTDPTDPANWHLCYGSSISPYDAVLRRLTQAEVDTLLDQIAGL